MPLTLSRLKVVGSEHIVPIYQYIVKIAARCNIDCTYCYEYNMADTSWRKMPVTMRSDTASRLAARIREHCEAHQTTDVSIILHGGEPLLVGPRHLDTLLCAFEKELGGLSVRYGCQSNGLLFNEAIGDVMLAHKMSIGISIDGPPSVNDRRRLTFAKLGTSSALEDRLCLLRQPRYRPLFSGFLTVVDINANPNHVIDYLASWEPGSIDFILPHSHRDSLPPGKRTFDSTEYGDWLVAAFERACLPHRELRVRMFDSLLRMMVGGRGTVESLGLGPVPILCVNTAGGLEALDALKATYDGATDLGLNVETHSIDDALAHTSVQSRMLGIDALCRTCQDCPIVEYCGGGYLPTRYSSVNGFANESVYCRDLEKLIYYIHERASTCVATALATQQASPAGGG